MEGGIKRTPFIIYIHGENGEEKRGRKPQAACATGLWVGIIWRVQFTRGTTRSRRASSRWGLRSCPRCGRAARLRRAVPRCCAECSKLRPGGGTRIVDRRFGGASARPQGLYRGAHMQAVATLLEPKNAKRSEKSASSHRRPALPAPQGGTFAHAATC